MKKNFHYQLIIILALYFPLSAIGQTSNKSNGYQKTIKFNSIMSVNDAKKKFTGEFGLDSRSTFVEFKSNSDKNGKTHKRYQQYYEGIKVEYGTMIIHSKDNNVTSINGELYNPNGLVLTSSLSSKLALENAISYVGAKTYLWSDSEKTKNNNYKKPEGELIILPVISNNKVDLKLAYKFDIYALAPVSRGYVYVDARNGNVLYNEPIIKHFEGTDNQFSASYNKRSINKSSFSTLASSGTADTRYSGNRLIETRAETDGTFTLNDDTRNVHTYNAQNSATNSDSYQFTTVDFADNDNNWTAAEYDNAARDNAALDAHWGAMKVYDFWAGLGRNSIDDAGMEMRSYVHLGTNYFNAFWNGSVMSYGDGNPNPLTSIDVVGHEMAHGITTWTANLVYARESGGMNEAFSDIFGAAIEFFGKGTGSDTSPNAETWLIGEDFGTVFRSMSDPKSKGDPDTYNGTNYIDASSNCIPTYGSGGNDGCGVHTNSSVLNHWFYILVAGEASTNDAGDIYNVTGIGMVKAQEIAYLILRDYLTPNSTFIDARNAGVEVASSLYGSNSAERKAVQDAFFAVNLGEEFIPFDTDLKLVQFNDLIDITCGEDIIPKIKVRNSGASNTINNIQVNYSVDGVAQTPYNWSGTLAVDAETEITLPALSESTVKSYSLNIETVVAGDGDSTNNALTGTFRVNRSDSTPTEVNTFENLLVDYWLTYNEGGGANLWTLGTPSKTILNNATSGSRAYITETSANYPDDTKAYLISKCYDLTTFTNNPIMKFNMAFELEENFDIVYMEYSTDAKNWTVLGSATDTNWYNSDRKFVSSEVSTDCENCPGAQWTGSSSGFNQYSYNLSSFTTVPKINFRFVFHSSAANNDEGVVIDDIVIEDSTLSVNDFDKLSNQVMVYPNPSANVFNISFARDYNNIDIDILDMTGRMVLSKKNISKQGKKHLLDMSNYSKGLYFARIKIESVSIVKKIILQ